MFYLERNNQGMFIWETDLDCDDVLHFKCRISPEKNESIPENNYYHFEKDSTVTTIYHLRNNLIAVSENYDAILGAAAMELI